MFCKNCGEKIYAGNSFCKNCGIRQDSHPKSKTRSKMFTVVAIVVGGLVVFGSIFAALVLSRVFGDPTEKIAQESVSSVEEKNEPNLDKAQEDEDSDSSDQSTEADSLDSENSKTAEAGPENTASQENKELLSKKQAYINKLDGIEGGLADLNYLYATGVTADMLEASSEEHRRWDDMLNEIWGVLKTQLPKAEMDELTRLQLNWLTHRDKMAESAAGDYGQGSFATVAYKDTLGQLTKDRCYELVYGYMK